MLTVGSVADAVSAVVEFESVELNRTKASWETAGSELLPDDAETIPIRVQSTLPVLRVDRKAAVES